MALVSRVNIIPEVVALICGVDMLLAFGVLIRSTDVVPEAVAFVCGLDIAPSAVAFRRGSVIIPEAEVLNGGVDIPPDVACVVLGTDIEAELSTLLFSTGIAPEAMLLTTGTDISPEATVDINDMGIVPGATILITGLGIPSEDMAVFCAVDFFLETVGTASEAEGLLGRPDMIPETGVFTCGKDITSEVGALTVDGHISPEAAFSCCMGIIGGAGSAPGDEVLICGRVTPLESLVITGGTDIAVPEAMALTRGVASSPKTWDLICGMDIIPEDVTVIWGVNIAPKSVICGGTALSAEDGGLTAGEVLSPVDRAPIKRDDVTLESWVFISGVGIEPKLVFLILGASETEDLMFTE